MHKPSIDVVRHMGVLLAAVVPSAMVTSLRSVYLVSVAELDPFVVGSFSFVSTVLGIVLVYYAGRGFIDKSEPIRLQLFAMSVLTLGSLSILFSASWPVLLIAATVFGAVGSIGGSAIFVYDERYGPPSADNAGLYRTRLVLSVAWIVGPPLAYLAFWLAGFEAVVAITTTMIVLAGATMLHIGRTRIPHPRAAPPARPLAQSDIAELGFWPIFIVMVATTAVNVLHAINLPLYVIETLSAPTFWPGLMMATAAGVEVLVIMFLPRLTAKTSDETVLWAGMGVGIVYFGLLNWVTDPLVILGCQVLYGAHFAATTVVCLPLLRKTLTGGTGSLAAQFNNASRIGGLFGSAVFALVATSLGYHGILTLVCEGLLVAAILTGIGRRLVARAHLASSRKDA